MRIVFAGGGTGGHLYPGIAIARALVRAAPDLRPFFIGAHRGIERDVLPTTEFPHLLLDLHPLYRANFWNNWRTIVGAAGAWRHLSNVVADDRPALIVGTGGYAAGLTMAHGVLHRIPIVQQAGDSHPGLTARAFSRVSREIYLNFPEASSVLRTRSPDVAVHTGAPIERPPSPRPDRGEARRRWQFPADGDRVILVYGGSQGALAINRAVAQWVESGLPAGVRLIWATGRGTYDQFQHLEGDRVRVRPYLAPIADAYAAADLAVARAGAMATAELMAWGLPSVLVPLPSAAANHQEINAQALERAGAAIHLRQSSLTGATLAAAVERVIATPGELARLRGAAEARARPNAAADIADRILRLLGRVAG